jgi:DNA replication protein DnaC
MANRAAAAITAAVAEARQLRELAVCPKHGERNAMACSECAIDRQEAGPDARHGHARLIAMDRCDAIFPMRFIDAVPDVPEVLAWLEQLTETTRRSPSLLFFGNPGTGKTHQAYAAMRAALYIHPVTTWVASTFPDFAAALRPRPGVDSEAEMDRFRTADLLLLDDIGVAKNSEWVEEITYRLINGRYESMRPTICTTNLTVTELRSALGDRISGRLAETCTRIILDGRDWRRAAN